MSVLLLPPIFQFFDNNGDPLANGFVYTYAAGTTTPLATYTDSTGAIAAPNPIELNSAGRPSSGSGAIWGQGAYKFIVKDANGVQIGDPLDNVTSFTTLASATDAYFESFSGNGSQTVFTTSSDLGTEEKGLMVFVNSGLQEIAVNGTFTTDTGWTKGAGWTIGAGVATAAGAISTAISQVPTISLVAGQAYAVTYTITRSAGGLIPSLGGQNGTERTASGTYREIIIAAATTPIAFTGNAFTGTLDSVSVTLAESQGYQILSPSAYTINATSLTFATAPATGTNNIYVFAPSLLLGAASAAAGLAQTYATAALASQTAAAISASSAAGYAAAKNQWTYISTTTMADPSTGNIRFNNATLSSVTAAAISNLSANAGNPDLSAWISTWDDTVSSPRGTLYIFKDNGNFVLYSITGATTDNAGWKQLALTYLAGSGSFTSLDSILIGFTANGTTTVTGGITALTGDVTASGTGSVATTVASASIADSSFSIKGSSDATKLAKFEVDGLTTATTRTVTVPDKNGTMAMLDDRGLVFISGQNASASAQIDFTSGITSSYEVYIIEGRNIIPATDDVHFLARYSIDGGASFLSASYVGQTQQIKSTTINGTTPTDGIHIIPATAGYRADSGAANDGLNFTLKIYNPAGSSVKYSKGDAVWFEAAGAVVILGTFGGCYRGGVQAVNALRFLFSSGNIASGEFYLYGVKTS